MRTWVYDPHSGGTKIPESVREKIRRRILAHAAKTYGGKYSRMDVRFHGSLCYIDAFQEPQVPEDSPVHGVGETHKKSIERLRNTPIHLVRLRYFGDENRWTLAFYTYSNERYEPCHFPSGKDHGTPEEALDVGAMYLDG